MNYKISVIIPVYNVENYLAQCLESVIRQTFKDIEIICINDGSKDSSKEILEKYQQKDKRILIINKNNEGYGAACNAGLRLARGKYISIIEPDDFIDGKMYEDLYNLAVEHNADIVKSSFYEYKDTEINSKESIVKINWSSEYNMPQKVFRIEDCSQFLYFHPSIWSCIYSHKFLTDNNISFVEEKGAGWVDNPFQVQTLCIAQRIYYTDNAYYYYRLTNPTSSSNIVNISNPFDRSDEIHSYLELNKIHNENILAHLYKREFGYIHNVLAGINTDLFDFAVTKIGDMTNRMDKKVIYENKYINDYEKCFYEQCHSRSGIEEAMKRIKQQNKKITVVSSVN